MTRPDPRRVARRWLTAELTFEWANPYMILMHQDGVRVGHLRITDDLPVPELLELAQCPKSLTKLYDQFGPGPVVKGWMSEVEFNHQRQGLGLQMYEAAIAELRRRHRSGFYFIPSMCGKRGEGTTTRAAQALWKALARKYPSAGHCLYIR